MLRTFNQTTLDILHAVPSNTYMHAKAIAVKAGYARTAVSNHLRLLEALRWVNVKWADTPRARYKYRLSQAGAQVRATTHNIEHTIPLWVFEEIRHISSVPDHDHFYALRDLGLLAVDGDCIAVTDAGEFARKNIRSYGHSTVMPLFPWMFDLMKYINDTEIDNPSTLIAGGRWPNVPRGVEALKSWGLVEEFHKPWSVHITSAGVKLLMSLKERV
jgi:DNA-binding HxlR family transcriptional regulator